MRLENREGCFVDNKERHRRLRLLIRKLNKERKKQAQKTDILCNDFISAQADFIKRLNTINFTANFYEAILGTTDLNSLLYTAGKLIKEEISDSNVAFFLLGFPFRRESLDGAPLQRNSFELYVPEGDKPLVPGVAQLQAIAPEKERLENCFTPELVDNICKSNRLCTLDDMFAMGLQGNLIRLSKISAITVPLYRFGSSVGFILIYRLSQNKLTPGELKNISAVTCGLSRAIQSCRLNLHSAVRAPTSVCADKRGNNASAGD
ncbi:MAG: hypothetical protein GWN67_17415 [Phycisphaerae bacterium]|nr:hypothetical protein [Phycisphaerae bacterium]NIP53998.1 hypothetical protein [Phycisphaerae bacterium]NIS51307.1 hypothetical protein [Phycisphaerae bacterium]NIU10400.1 hypothetical protein [Phycisphaerae bacterium]NIU58098.1 hypothetical protein [Phycisphaerae bacterium]